MPVQTLVTTPQAENTIVNPNRSDGYLSAWTIPLTGKELGSVAEGTYYTAISATSGTGLLGHAAPTTFDQTKAFLYLFNSGGKTIYPQFVTFTETAASVGGTTGGLRIVPVIDYGNRWVSGGTALTISNNNSASSNTSGAASMCLGGAPVLAAATANARNYGDIVFRQTLIDIIGDKFTIVFGGTSAMGNVASVVATLAEFSQVTVPMAIGPNASLGLHIWRTSMSTGPTLEIQMGWIER